MLEALRRGKKLYLYAIDINTDSKVEEPTFCGRQNIMFSPIRSGCDAFNHDSSASSIAEDCDETVEAFFSDTDDDETVEPAVVEAGRSETASTSVGLLPHAGATMQTISSSSSSSRSSRIGPATSSAFVLEVIFPLVGSQMKMIHLLVN